MGVEGQLGSTAGSLALPGRLLLVSAPSLKDDLPHSIIVRVESSGIGDFRPSLRRRRRARNLFLRGEGAFPLLWKRLRHLLINLRSPMVPTVSLRALTRLHGRTRFRWTSHRALR